MATAADTLAQLERKDLEATAKTLEVKFTGIPDIRLIRNIIRAAQKMEILAENSARAEIKQESAAKLGIDPNAKKRPSPQDVAVRNSRKVIVEFQNIGDPATDENDGADLPFTVGTHTFHLYDGQRHVMPECLVTYKPLEDKHLIDVLEKFWASCRMTKDQAKARTIIDLVMMSLARRCTFPVYKEVVHEASGMVESKRIKDRPRFRFNFIGPAPKDAVLGSIVDPDPEEIMSDDEMIQEAQGALT